MMTSTALPASFVDTLASRTDAHPWAVKLAAMVFVTGLTAAAAQVKRHAEARIAPMLDRLEAQLAEHGEPWFLGARYSAVDPYVLMMCRWTRNHARPARSRPHIAPYLERMLARPAVQRAFATERLPPPLV